MLTYVYVLAHISFYHVILDSYYYNVRSSVFFYDEVDPFSHVIGSIHLLMMS